jgi:hypothetical protein
LLSCRWPNHPSQFLQPALTTTAISRIYRVVGLVKDAVTSASVRTVTFVDVLPGGHQSFADISDLLAAGQSETNNHWLLVVGFTDTNGLSWNRLADGRLRQSSRPGEIADE